MFTGFLIRLDDIAENMDWDMMERASNLFEKFHVKPILGIVPNNKDPELLNYPKKYTILGSSKGVETKRLGNCHAWQ